MRIQPLSISEHVTTILASRVGSLPTRSGSVVVIPTYTHTCLTTRFPRQIQQGYATSLVWASAFREVVPLDLRCHSGWSTQTAPLGCTVP